MAYRAHPGTAKIYWDSLAMWAAARAATDKEVLLYTSTHALSLVAAGQKAAAIRELQQLPANVGRRNVFVAEEAAEAYVLAGEYDAALEQLEAITPNPVTPSLLQADPIWDPLRQLPRFKKLLEKK